MTDASGPTRRVYMDHAATTPVHPDVAALMAPYLTDQFGNPSSLHFEGRSGRDALEAARVSVLSTLDAGDFDLAFTSGGTEANNAAILGCVLAARRERPGVRPHVVACAVEHAAVLETLRLVEDLGGETDVVGVDRNGRVDREELAAALTPHTAVVSLMTANNETGVLQPVAEVGRAVRARGILMHTDAVQALGKLPLSLDRLPVDLVSISAHKIYGPKGVGGLCVRRGIAWRGWMQGGAQEGGHRGGTENIAGAVGMALAAEEAVAEQQTVMRRLEQVRDALWLEIRARADRLGPLRLNTDLNASLPTILNIAFIGVDGESLVRRLDWHGVAVSTGSACNIGAKKASHVLQAMGRHRGEVRGSIRFSLGRSNTEADVEPVLAALEESVATLRAVSPA